MNKTALVTGSSRGIGKAIAISLAKSGHDVIAHATSYTDELKLVEKELKKIKAGSSTIAFDVSSRQEVIEAFEELGDKAIAIDVLVNNAGIVKDRTLMKMSISEWDLVIKTNLYGPFNVIQQSVSGMRERKFGRIINISSVVALKGNFGQANYAASKAGLIGLTKSLAKEVAKYNITVNAICPGLINTQMTSGIPQDYKNLLLSQVSLGRMGEIDEVAGLVNYIASEQAGYITGAVIRVDGGWL